MFTKMKRKGNGSTASNERFGAMAALPRRQFCANLNVITPQEVQWKPPLRQAAGTLHASGGDSAIGKQQNGIESQTNNIFLI
jgi:hypothetical protein